MDADLAQELLNKLGSSLESLETQQAVLMQFLKEKGIVTDEQLAPYLSQAGNASSVRWRAARVRLERLIAVAADKEQQAKKQQGTEAAKTQTPPQQKGDASRAAAKTSPNSPTKETAQPEAKKSETAETKPAETARGAKPNEDEGKPSLQNRKDEAA
jgi:hypothetical protein